MRASRNGVPGGGRDDSRETDSKPRNAYRAGKIGTSIHFTEEAHADLWTLQFEERKRLRRPVSQQYCLRIALDNYFEANGFQRHFETESPGPSTRESELQQQLDDAKKKIEMLNAEIDELRRKRGGLLGR